MTAVAPAAGRELEGFRDFIEGVQSRWHVPGVSVAVVKDGEVIMSEGFGYRDLERRLPVTTKTIFAIGSSTKAFTTMSLATLVDEGKLDWDTSVRNYLPWFAMYDQFTTERITPRDLVTHRSGLPRYDHLWYNNTTSKRADLIRRLRYLAPSADFRTVFQYQNLMFLTAGYLAGEVAGSDWETVVRERILDPLRMGSANFSVKESQASDDFALPYVEKDGSVRQVDFRNIDLVGPAGSINANVEDMTKWLLLHLNKGWHDDRQIVSEPQVGEMHRGHMVMPAPFLPLPENDGGSYGLGWFIETYNGDTLIHHGGAIDGFLGQVAFLPKHNAGVVVQTNLGGSLVPFIIAYNALDRLRGREPSDLEPAVRKVHDEAVAALARGKERSDTEKVESAGPSHDLDAYVGSFDHPGFGRVTIGRNDVGLTFGYNGEMFPLIHYHYDVFHYEMRVVEVRIPVSFGTSIGGDIDRLWVALEPTMPAGEYSRAPDDIGVTPDFLKRFVGEYEVLGRTAVVSLEHEDALVLTLPAQPRHELERYRENQFKIKGLDGYLVEFKTDSDGTVTHAIFVQPTGVFEAEKKNEP